MKYLMEINRFLAVHHPNIKYKRKKSFFNSFKSSGVVRNFYKIIYKKYRFDLNLWEERKKIFWFILYYKYLIFKKGKLYIQRTLFLKNKETKKYFKFIPFQKLKVGSKEFKEKYKNNKWLVPVDCELDLDIP